jgi:methylase of polypeptide subunit release factors
LLLEHGYDQGQLVGALMERRGLDAVETQADLNDLPRITLGRWPA